MAKLNLEPSKNIMFFATDPSDNKELLRISQDGFYVRGVKLEQDENEARALFDAFKEWLDKANSLPSAN